MSDPRVAFFLAKLQLEGLSPTPRWLFVSVVHQRLWAYQGTALTRQYPCSTSIKPPSCAYGSHGTPLGLHRVEEKLGEGLPPGTILEQRVSTGRIFTPGQPDSLITSRILWLAGMEKEKNLGYACGSHNRKIYLHGTNHEEKIGTPASAGCVQLTNADILELFDWTPTGSWVFID